MSIRNLLFTGGLVTTAYAQAPEEPKVVKEVAVDAADPKISSVLDYLYGGTNDRMFEVWSVVECVTERENGKANCRSLDESGPNFKKERPISDEISRNGLGEDDLRKLLVESGAADVALYCNTNKVGFRYPNSAKPRPAFDRQGPKVPEMKCVTRDSVNEKSDR